MEYSELLKSGIENAGISLSQVCLKLMKKDITLDKALLSKMQNGKFPPAKDEVNIALADVLGINPNELRLAAAKEVIPSELFQLIKEIG